MGVLGDMGRDFQQGYRNGSQQAEKNPKMVMAVFLTVLVFVALYFVQKWTDLAVFDWTINVLKWIGNGIEYLFHKLMSLISN